ncbi:hypothetical protein GCM10011581_35940 [Saccharopolyspora subtropica]|uniref:HTH cro/C1-type domain-containing protein n=1 Tax=Saccharopolyspora thermophila TaxID=89367 RepID=A0A917K2U7_9PSEU|nr:helix-turn-helix transcriptional regulator [Saccharopolyspora subtropica]GGI95602.1 hypothetical protein GCM10011581_35940 [Saccharopolyspora subtropica]
MPQDDTRIPNTVLIALRERAGLSQQDLADELTNLAATRYGKHPQITRKTIGRWERGEVVWPQPFYRRLLAQLFHCAADELGFRRPRLVRSEDEPTMPMVSPPTFTEASTAAEPHVEHDQDQWRHIRSALDRHRRDLAVLAESWYPDHRIAGLENTGVISSPAWLPAEPVPLDEITLALDPAIDEPLITGEEPESAAVRPLANIDTRFRCYHDAIRDLAAPRLFENRLCFRLAELDWTRPHMRFGLMSFFDAMDINEALAHEFAAHHLAIDDGNEKVVPRASRRRLAFRKLVADPFDLRRRPLMGAIGTLTIRGGECPSVVLHHRDSARVAGGGGMVHLIPAGIFQPSSVIPAAITADFSIWRNIQREYAEELLDHGEFDGSGKPIRYHELEPFTALDNAVRNGHIRVFSLGVVLDALTLAGDILTVAIIAPDTYDAVFTKAVEANAEGSVPARTFPFEENTLTWLRDSKRLSPGAAAALHLAWTHRKLLLN